MIPEGELFGCFGQVILNAQVDDVGDGRDPEGRHYPPGRFGEIF